MTILDNTNMKAKLFLFSGIILFSIFGIFALANADCSSCSYDYNDYNYNGCSTCGSCSYSSSSCYDPANWEGQCTTCYQQQNSCDSWGPNYCYASNVYHQRNCYRVDSNGVRTNYTDNQLVQYCVAGQTCQNGQCVVACECSGGPCCDGCHFKSATTTCNSQTQQEYGCPWGSACGSDVGLRTKIKYQYCSGSNNQCIGNWGDWMNLSGWTIAASCSGSQTCVQGLSTCQSTSSCPVVPTYIKHFKKLCYENSLFWFDSNNSRNDMSQDCVDGNDCTIDSCQGSNCVNELKCDGSTCAVESEDYCEKCNRCGDGVCGCGETIESCSDDCEEMNGLPLTIFIKKNNESVWLKDLSFSGGEEVYFLAVASNNDKDEVQDVVVKIDIPDEVVNITDLKIDNNSYSGNIRDGINIGTLAFKEAKTISFRGEIANSLSRNGADIVGTIGARNMSLASSDSMKVAFGSPLNQLAAATSWRSFLKSKYLLPLLITIVVLLFVARTIYTWFFKK